MHTGCIDKYYLSGSSGPDPPNEIACGLRSFANNGNLFLDQIVENSRFSRIGAANERDEAGPDVASLHFSSTFDCGTKILDLKIRSARP